MSRGSASIRPNVSKILPDSRYAIDSRLKPKQSCYDQKQHTSFPISPCRPIINPKGLVGTVQPPSHSAPSRHCATTIPATGSSQTDASPFYPLPHIVTLILHHHRSSLCSFHCRHMCGRWSRSGKGM